MKQAPEVVSADPASFPWSVFHRRHPVLIEQVIGALPRPTTQRAALDALLAESVSGVLTAPERPWPWWRPHYAGLRWTDVPFLWAESYFYRRLLDAVEYFAPGPWRGIDPFGPIKAADLAGTAVDDELAALDDLAGRPLEEQRTALVASSLWGNRADLSFEAGAPTAGSGGGLLADDSALLWSTPDTGSVHLIADNAGRELLPDLILLDHLLVTGRARDVVLHVKPHPYYVSDATPFDVLSGARRLSAAPGIASDAGARLAEAIRNGTLTIRAHEFFCAPLPYPAMPPDLRAELAGADLVIVKGDLNYRRLVEDRHWPATTPFAELTEDFPAPLVALRTLKCDVVVGLSEPTLAKLDAGGEPWRTTGAYAVIQGRP